MLQKVIKKTERILKHHYVRLFSYPVHEINEDLSYDEYWKKRRNTRGLFLGAPQQMRLDRLVEILTKNNFNKVKSVIDVGGADGSFIFFFKQRVPTIESILCVDSSSYALENAKVNNIATLQADLSNKTQVSEIPMADLLYALEVLEHIPNPEMLLRQMYLKANQAVVFSFPNTGYFTYRIRMLLGKFPLQWVVHPSEHLRFWTFKDVDWWMKAQGYKNYKLVSHRGIPVVNKILPNLFSADIFVLLTTEAKDHLS